MFTVPSRQRFLLAACVASLALVVSPVAEGSAAPLHPESGSVVQAPAFPLIGTEVPTSMTAVDVPVEVDGVLFKVDLRGGMRQRVEADPAEPDPTRGVLLRTIGFHLEGTTADGQLRVTFDLNDSEPAPPGTLRVQEVLPPAIQERDVIPLVLTVERAGQPALTLHSVDPAILSATLQAFPPQGDTYQLVNPVAFVVPGSTTPVAHLLALPVQRGVAI